MRLGVIGSERQGIHTTQVTDLLHNRQVRDPEVFGGQ